MAACRALWLLPVVVLAAACASSATPHTTSRTAGWLERPPSVVQTGGGAVSVFPAPGTLTASPRSEISIRGIAPASIGAVTVVGSQSGRHRGRLVAHRDGHGASFVLAKPFAPGEHVRVTTKLTVRGGSNGSYAFTVARPAPEPPPAKRSKPPTPTGRPVRFSTHPAFRMTPVTVTTHRPAAVPGLVFVAPRRGIGQDALELLDGNGKPVWFQPVPKGTGATDLRKQTYRGAPVLTWWQGKSALGHGYGEGVIVDDEYRRVATVRAGNGYAADLHEFELTSANTAFVTAYRVVHWDLSSVGGPANGLAYDCVAQEVEVGTGRVLFEWHSLGNVPLSYGYEKPPNATSSAYDYFHINSITSDDRGDVLISSRGTHTIFEVDPRTAAIHWRLGGKHSDFALGDGVSFHSQHNAKWIGPQTMTIFDNGAGVGGNNHSESRGIVVHIDRAARRATLVRQLPQPHGKLFASQGNVEVLPNGDYFVGWGEGPYATEFDSKGRVVWALHFASASSYRAYRFPWNGHPRTTPSVVVQRNGGNTNVAVSWNGATDVARWQVLAGSDAGSLAPVATVRRAGFETHLATRTSAPLVAVRALDASGEPLATSAPVHVAS